MRSFSIACAFALWPAISVACDQEFHFNEASRVSNPYPDASIVKIYSDNKYRGTGTLIDKENGYILTACHVVVGQPKLSVSFNETQHSAHLSVIPIEKSIPARCEPDVALIKLADGVPSYGEAVNVGFQEPKDRSQHEFLVGGEGRTSPLSTEGKLSRQSLCHYIAEVNTYRGNSGSPVFAQSGLLIGIVKSGSHTANHVDGTKGIAKVLPLSCASEFILTPRDDPEGLKIWNELITSDEIKLRAMLDPAKSSRTEWLNNIILAHAVNTAFREPGQPKPSLDRLLCPLLPAVTNRGLGSNLQVQLLAASLDAKVARARADKVQKRANALEAQNASKAQRLAALTESELLHSAYLQINDQGLREALLPADSLTSTGKTQTGRLKLAQSLKALADINLKIAKLTGDVARNENAFKFGVIAAQLSGENTAVAANSMLAAGVAAARAGTFSAKTQNGSILAIFGGLDWGEVAIQSFNEAAKVEPLPGWATKNYLDLWAMRSAPGHPVTPSPGEYVPAADLSKMLQANDNRKLLMQSIGRTGFGGTSRFGPAS